MRRWLALLTIVGGACGGGGGDGPDAAPPIPMCEPGMAFDLSGRTAVQALLNVHVNAAGLVETDTTSELLLLLDIEQSGASLDVTATPCAIEIPEIMLSGQDMPVHFETGPGLVESVPAVVATGSLDGQQTCAHFTADPITLVLGARLDPPDQALLPESDDMGLFTECAPAGSSCALAVGSNCACDQEADGKAGATLLAMNTPGVRLSEVYVDLRSTFTLTGEVWSSDLIIGGITATLEQGILDCRKEDGADCSNSEVNIVRGINPDVTQQPGNPSTWRAVRVASTLSCAELIAMKDTLFPR